MPPRPEDFRTLPGTREGEFGPRALLAFRELRNGLADLSALLNELGDDLRLSLPRWPDMGAPVDARAASLRDVIGISVDAQMQWRTTPSPLERWREALFDLGVVVQVFVVPIGEVRAFSVVQDALGGIGVSSEDSRRGRTFSIFHEVCHLCLGRPGVSAHLARHGGSPTARTVEGYCDAFAAAFLLPAEHPAVMDALKAVAADFGREQAERYASRFAVSKYVLARRLLDLGQISRDRYWDEDNAWRAHDREIALTRRAKQREAAGGPSAAVVRLNHAGRRYVATVIEALHRGILTRHEAAEVLAVRPDALSTAQEMAISA